MTAQQLLTINAMSHTASHLSHLLGMAAKDLSRFQCEESELDGAQTALLEASKNAETASVSFSSILSRFPNDNDFFSLFEKEYKLEQYQLSSWIELYEPGFFTFSSDWMEYSMPQRFKKVQQTQFRAIHQRGLAWYEARLHTSAVNT